MGESAACGHLPLEPTAGPVPTTFLWGTFPVGHPCTGAARGGGAQLCGLLTPLPEHFPGATVSPWAAPTFHVGSGEVGHPLPPPGHAAWVRSATRLRASWGGVLSTQPPGDSAPGTLTGSPLLGLQVVKKRC